MDIPIELILPYREQENRHKIFDALLENLEDGMTFTLTKSDIASGDRFLIFNDEYRPKQVITVHRNCVPYWLEFDCDEPIRLEECPTSFYRTLLLNLDEGNYTIKE